MTNHETYESLAALDALGAATADERSELLAHLDQCADCRRAHDQCVEAAAIIGSSVSPVNPPPEIRSNIMNAVDETPDEMVVIDRKSFDATRWWLATAATIFFALWAWRELGIRASREKIALRDAEILNQTVENTLVAQRAQKLNSEIASLAAKDTKMILLAGQQVSPSASARVFLVPAQRRAIVLFANLPANPDDRSYQLWIIRADQATPQSAGVFDVSSNGTATISIENLPVETEIKGMAVTLEPKGGVEKPTNANYYVMGKS